MPIRKVCASPGCSAYAEEGTTRCLQHKKRERTGEYTQVKKESNKIYQTRTWKTLRKQVLADEPLCRACFSRGQMVEATHVDHIIPLSQGGAPYDRQNLQPLCRSCNSRKGTRTWHYTDIFSQYDKTTNT